MLVEVLVPCSFSYSSPFVLSKCKMCSRQVLTMQYAVIDMLAVGRDNESKELRNADGLRKHLSYRAAIGLKSLAGMLCPTMFVNHSWSRTVKMCD